MRDSLELSLSLTRVDRLLLAVVAQQLFKTYLFLNHQAEDVAGARVGVISLLIILILKADLPKDKCELLHQRLLALNY